jgi:hypothetical protein
LKIQVAMPHTFLGRLGGAILIIAVVAVVVFFFAAILVIAAVAGVLYVLRLALLGKRQKPPVSPDEVSAHYEVLTEHKPESDDAP